MVLVHSSLHFSSNNNSNNSFTKVAFPKGILLKIIMKAFVAIATLALVAAVSADGLGGLGHGIGHHGLHHDIHAYPAYKYSYGVADKHTGDIKNAAEVRDGAITKGSYSLVQPDGVLRTVNYVVDPKGGFQAQVINKGHAVHPAIKHVGIHHGGHLGGHLGGHIGGHHGGAISHIGGGGLGHGLGGIGYGAGLVG